jgi:hypothetical protein
MKTLLKILPLAAVALTASALGAHDQFGDPDAHGAVTRRGAILVAALELRPPRLPGEFLHEFKDPRRLTVDFDPLHLREDQRGVRLGLMTLEQRRCTHDLLRCALSEEGYLRLQSIRALEEDLRAEATDLALIHDPDAYTVQIFGRPSAGAPWGFKVEGHHLSVNVTLSDGQFRGTPLFLGSSPAEVRGGPDAGVRILGPQEGLARELVGSLTEQQRAVAIQSEFVPGKAIAIGPLAELDPPVGLAAVDMSAAQRAFLVHLVASYAANLRPDFAAEELRFLWRGSTQRGAEFSYVILGPTVAIQLDAIDDPPGSGANHLHLLWRDPARDFGVDLLERHYAEERR